MPLDTQGTCLRYSCLRLLFHLIQSKMTKKTGYGDLDLHIYHTVPIKSDTAPGTEKINPRASGYLKGLGQGSSHKDVIRLGIRHETGHCFLTRSHSG